MKNKKGITLIALIITIIVLLILAGITISTLSGDNGILQKGKEAATEWRGAEETEQGILDGIYNEMANISNDKKLPTIASKFNDDDTGEIKIGDYVNYSQTPLTLTNSTEVIENLTNYSGNTNSAYNKVDSTNPIKQEIGLKWRVLDKTAEGEIRLISEKPTTSKVMLSGAKGYNNAVKLLDDFCSDLYENSSLASNVQNLKVEDIENKLTAGALSELHAAPYGTYANTYATAYSKYPKIWEQEIGAKINGIAQNGTIDLSDSTSYTTDGAVTTASSIQVKRTIKHKSFGTSNNGQFEKDMYYELVVIKEGETYLGYWLSSRGVNDMSNMANFDVFCINFANLAYMYLFASNDHNGSFAFSVRPVITLNSGVKVTGGDGVMGWNIQ